MKAVGLFKKLQKYYTILKSKDCATIDRLFRGDKGAVNLTQRKMKIIPTMVNHKFNVL